MIPHLGHYIRVGLATFFACIAVYETLQDGLMATHVLIWWAAVLCWIVVVAIEGARRNEMSEPDTPASVIDDAGNAERELRPTAWQPVLTRDDETGLPSTRWFPPNGYPDSDLSAEKERET